ncbi:arginine--tRNA ligase [Deinococcus sp.]|uniref:arginine--tRNA ligase n=1 Tax=Deinococcus sp. TaxID=47478 RepID=UPI0025C5F25E|nr:arginine--tRNA ligase [Deinococcus sp.]
MDLKAQLKQAVETAAQQLGMPVDAAIQETPSSKPGDYGTPAAFQMAKAAGRNPAEVAAQLAAAVVLPAGIKKVEAVGPFINFFLDIGDFVRGVVEKPFQMPALSGKVVIEHTSVNPNKELHVGHLRNVVLGDSMARIFRAAGHTVEVQNYIDDTGRQAAESLFAIEHYHRVWDGETKYDQWLGEGYVQLNADPQKPELEAGIMDIMHKLEAGVLRPLVEQTVKAQLATCFRLGARYDLLNWESDVVGSGFLAQAMNILEGSRYTSRPSEGKYAGAFIMDVSEFMPGLEEPNVVLVRSGGTAMYAAKDIGYQFWKFGLFEGMKFKPFMPDPEGREIWTSAPDGQPDDQKRFGHAQEVINVIDSRQDHPQTVVRSALGVAGETGKKERSIHLSYAFVTLEGQTISGRRGVVVSADDAMDEAEKRALAVLSDINPELAKREDAAEIARRIGIGAIRFAMLKAEPTRKIDFRWEQALALNGDTAPYVQYAAVRATNILRRAEEAGLKTDGTGADWESIPKIDLVLAKQVAKLPEVVAQSVRVHSPHVVAQYALDLATSFNAWYNAKDKQGKPATNVLQSEVGLREARLALMVRLRQAFEETAALIGIEIPAAM